MTSNNQPSDDELSFQLTARTMIRNRSLESYEALLGLDITEMAEERVREKGRFIWYDLCCGSFEAGIDLKLKKHNIANKMEVVGVDLSGDDKQRAYGVVIKRGNVVDYPLPPHTDLVTCLRGLRYVAEYLGQEQAAQAVEHWYRLIPGGSVIAFDTTERSVVGDDRGDLPIFTGGVLLSDSLKARLGDAIKTGNYQYCGETAFTVKMFKER